LRTHGAISGSPESRGGDWPASSAEPIVLVIPTLHGQRAPSGKLVVTRKYLTGLDVYASLWPGKVVSAVRISGSLDDGHLDAVEHDPARSRFELRELPEDPARIEEQLRAASVVMLTDGQETYTLAGQCQQLGIPYVLTLEWDASTRRQILWQEAPSRLRGAKRILWAEATNFRRLRTIRAAAGLQCNGTPAFEAYRGINARPLLYFDSRVGPEMVVAEQPLEARLGELGAGGPLRLVFSGRLVAIKGVDHLPRFASALARAGIAFSLDICGGGALEGALREQIDRRGLAGRVRLRGTLDFERELMPFVAGHTDLFICCHTQGDPSCTYLETMACGVPVVGYGNPALRGIVERSGAGWSIPDFNPERLAGLVATLAGDRAGIAERSRSAREFALAHTFDKTMQERTRHLLACSLRPAAGAV
jgi:glycosyltransferase involved in cell wall biosynthesis